MGIIAGIVSFKNGNIVNKNLPEKMLLSQEYRTKGPNTIFSDINSAIGMRNQYANNLDIKKNQNSNIIAFIDGILLEKSKTLNKLNSKYDASIDSTKIIELAYRKWGLDFRAHLEGEFTCAILDRKNKTLILSRDPFGKKPLHYYYNKSKVIFSSEIKGILTTGIQKELNLIALSDFLSLNNIPYPDTIFKNIYQVPPGSILSFSAKGIKKIQYWYPQISENNSFRLEETIDLISEKIKTAVKKRMVSNSTYTFLSGGIDSSAIASYAAEISNQPIHTISVGFEEEEKNELADAEIMSKHIGAIHHLVIAKPESFFEMLDTIVFHQDSPFTDTSAYPTYYAAKLAREFTDIILTGDGPDQSMAGSGHYVFAVKNNIFAKRNNLLRKFYKMNANFLELFINDPTPSILSKIQRKLFRDSFSTVHAAYDLRAAFPNMVKKYMLNKDLWEIHKQNDPYRHPQKWFDEAKNVDNINKYLYADMKFYVPDDLMIKVDRMSMAHNLETLSPFLDINLVEIVNSLPVNDKIKVLENGDIVTKYILKRVCENRFPKHILKKKKQGFGIPIYKWLKQENGKFLREVLLDPKTLNRGFFKKQSIEKLVDVFLNNQGDYYFPSSYAIVALVTFELWQRKNFDFS